MVYVDDILITGENKDDIQQVIQDLHAQFALKSLGAVNYFLGFEVHQSSSGLHLSNTKSATKLLHKTDMFNAKSCPTPMCLSNKLSLHDSEAFSHPSLYRTLTLPDLAFSINKLRKFLHAHTVAHWGACKRILRYIKGTLTRGLTFTPTQFLTLEGYADDDWASNLDDRKSVSGICVFLGGKLITWSSKKQQVVA